MNCTKCDQPTAGKSKYCFTHRAEARTNFKEMCAVSEQSKVVRETQYREWIQGMSILAEAAYMAAKPSAMVVYESVGLSDAPKPDGASWYVADGACGFAWITITPATCSFARWLAKNEIGYKAYAGGWQIPMHFFIGQIGQSIERAEAAAYACSQFLRDQGIKTHSTSRMD